jgi:predicted ribosome quality control (RQC) complex YloA/Tae2 family protein
MIQRAAQELEQRLRGARASDAGLLPDGRIAVTFRARDGAIALAADLFGTPPLVTLERAELPIAIEPGFVRKLATTVRGMTVTGVRARRGDRVLRIDFGTRSRFGIGDEVSLVLELVPRFGNAILVKGDTIVAAAKEFSLAENPARAIAAGQPYVPPPPRRKATPAPQSVPDDGPGQPPVLELFARMQAQRSGQREHHGVERRRRAILRRLGDRDEKLRAELRSLDDKRREAESRESLREQGEAIFTSLHQLDESARTEAKERAAKLFARYKKLQASLPHVESRQADVASMLDAVDVLRWEAERAGDEDVDDVERAVDALEARRPADRVEKAIKRKRRPLEFRTPAGSRILVGRSPAENADVTFRVARPDDLWFHAQGIPGAHVVLARDDRSSPPVEDLALAAALAAFHSKARASATVAVDYTRRKYVRKQKNAPPGLVWYTHPKTILAEPIREDALRTLSSRRS